MTGLVVAFAESSKRKTHEFGTSRSGSLRSGQGQLKTQTQRRSHVRNPHGSRGRLLRGYCWSTEGLPGEF